MTMAIKVASGGRKVSEGRHKTKYIFELEWESWKASECLELLANQGGYLP